MWSGASLGWTSFNLPGLINGSGVSLQFWYAPDRQRFQQLVNYAGGSETTHYLGGILARIGPFERGGGRVFLCLVAGRRIWQHSGARHLTMNRSINAVLTVIAMATLLLVLGNCRQYEEDRAPAEEPTALLPLIGHAPITTESAESPPAALTPSHGDNRARAWDKDVIIVFPDGSPVRLTLRRARLSPAPFPWPDRIIDQYEALRRLAEGGDSAAAIALHRYLSECENTHRDEASLMRAVERLHREGVLERPDGSLTKYAAIPGGDLTQFEYSALRQPYEFCRGITVEQQAELPTWTQRAAEAGDVFGLTAWARSLGATDAARVAWEKAWWHGVRSAPAALATLYERDVPGMAAGRPDYVRAYAFRLISLKLHEAWYGEHPLTRQRNELASMEGGLRHTSGFLTPQEQAQAVQLAREMLEQNRNCCTGVWPGVW